MNDDESRVDPKGMAADDHYGEALLYDFAKFVTTLAILAVGGVLTITQTADPKDVKPVVVAFVLGAIALAGVLSVSTASALAEARSAGQEPRAGLRGMMKAATGLLGVGTGGFLMMWWDSLT